MSRDLTCNETMPTLDDGENISDVRRLVNSRVINQQPFATQLNLLSGNRSNTNTILPNINHTTTVRDVISSRMRNKGNPQNEAIFPVFSTSHPVRASPISSSANSSESANTNFLQSLMNETSKSLSQRQELVTANQLELSQSSVTKPMQTSASVNLQYQQLAQANQSTPTLISIQPKSSSVYNRSSGMGINFGYNPTSSSTNSIILQSVPATTTFSSAVVTNNCYVNNSNLSLSTIRNSSDTLSSGNILTSHRFTGYVLPNTNTVVVNGNAAASNYLQQSTDSPSKVLINRQQGTSSSPSTVIFANTTSAQFVQQYPSRPSSSFTGEVTLGSVVRASNVSPSKTALGLTRGVPPYAVVLPQRSEAALQNVSRESPNGLSSHGCTTPTSSQVPPNSHSSPRPSILRGNSLVRRLVEKENNSSSPNFSSVNFSAMESTSIASINFASNTSIATTSTSNEDSSTKNISSDDRLDDSPRKRQRKQQFDNSQQLQDKLMMEVRPDPRLEQLATDSYNQAFWKLGSGMFPGSSSSPTVLKSGYSSGSEFGSLQGLSGKEPRRRGRPRSIHRGSNESYIPTASINSTTSLLASNASTSSASTPIIQGHSQKTTYVNTPSVAYGTAPPSSILICNNSNPNTGSSINNLTSRSFMVDVDSMLQVSPSAKKPRKYKKRTPELNPETGEPIKKPRKKGSGRKSKKELLLLEAAKKGLALNFGSVLETNSNRSIGELLSSASKAGITPDFIEFRQHCQQQQASSSTSTNSKSNVTPLLMKSQIVPSVSLFSRLAMDERSVVSTLCKLKSLMLSKSADKKVIEPELNNEKFKEPIVVCNEKEKVIEKEYKKVLPEEYANNLLDITKYGNLRHLWKASDRNLGNSLAENYDKITKCIANSKESFHKKSSLSRKTLISKNYDLSLKYRSSLICPMFDTYQDFKNSLESLQLLPSICKYYKSSKTLIYSLRNSLQGYSAFCLAKKLIRSYNESSNDGVLKELDLNNIKPISGLKPTDERLKGKCDNVFKYLFEEFNGEKEISNRKNNKNFALEQCLLIDMDVTELLDSLTDKIENLNTNENNTIVKMEIENNNPSTSHVNLADELFIPPSAIIGTKSSKEALDFVDKMPEEYRLLFKNKNQSSKKMLKNSRRRLRKHLESSSESDQQQQINDCDEELVDDRSLTYLVQRLRESNERSFKFYRNIRKTVLRLLENLEPMRYAEVINSDKINEDIRSAESAKKLKEDLETSFLLDISKYKSTFKSLNVYNASKSSVVRPSKELINSIFKNNHPYNNVGEVKKNDTSRNARFKSAAVERFREESSNFLVLEELIEKEQNSAHISSVSLARLQRKYGHTRSFSNMSGILRMYCSGYIDKKKNQSDDDFFKDSFEFNRSLKPIFSPNDVNLQLKYFEDRCKETHEMSAVIATMTHSRANILRQCYESLLDIQTSKAADEWDVEIDIGKNHNEIVPGDEDVDDSVASSGSDNDFDQSSDEFENHRQNSLKNYGNSPLNLTFGSGKGSVRKRRWPTSTNNSVLSNNRRNLNLNKRYGTKQGSVDNHSDDDSFKNDNINTNKRLIGRRSACTSASNNYGLLK